MQDRYLFRGKRIDNGEWVTGGISDDHQINKAVIMRMSNRPKFIEFDVVQSTLGQCTGLRDKNGKLIFEGDLLKNNLREIFSVDYCVEWGAYRLLCHIYKDKDGSLIEVSGGAKALDKKRALNFEVIGNIHDNPELLEAQS